MRILFTLLGTLAYASSRDEWTNGPRRGVANDEESSRDTEELFVKKPANERTRRGTSERRSSDRIGDLTGGMVSKMLKGFRSMGAAVVSTRKSSNSEFGSRTKLIESDERPRRRPSTGDDE